MEYDRVRLLYTERTKKKKSGGVYVMDKIIQCPECCEGLLENHWSHADLYICQHCGRMYNVDEIHKRCAL